MNSFNLKPGERTEKCRKMRHNCNGGDNCFEKKYRCQLGKLDHLFPGYNGMTDIDGYCFINGYKIFLEWKASENNLPPKQLQALKALSKDALVVIAWGDPMEMKPTSFQIISNEIVYDKVIDADPNVVCKKFDEMIIKWSHKTKTIRPKG